MKTILTIFTAVCLASNCLSQSVTTKIHNKMKMNAGIVTKNIVETKKFYTTMLGFGVKFENDFYLLLHSPNQEDELSFLLPNHPSQRPLFHKQFSGDGMYLTIEVEDVDKVYKELKEKGADIVIDLRDEPWGDRHFAIQDPNGIGIDIVTNTTQQETKNPDNTANAVSWFSIPADNLDRAISFYKDAFNWHIEPETKEDNDLFSYYVAVNSKSDANYIADEKGVINGCIVKREIGLSMPAVLVEVDDLDTAMKKVKSAGGEIITQKVLMKSLNGHFVLVKDTEGNFVELFQSGQK